jgi:Zn-dependent membrane protease YugP
MIISRISMALRLPQNCRADLIKCFNNGHAVSPNLLLFHNVTNQCSAVLIGISLAAYTTLNASLTLATDFMQSNI